MPSWAKGTSVRPHGRLRQRGDTVAGVFCAPEKPGEAADPLRLGAEQLGIPVYALPSLRVEEARQALQALARGSCRSGLRAAIRAAGFRDDSAPRNHSISSRHCCRAIAGPSSINWPIILGDTRTGLTIFRPVDGLDEGPIILQKETPIGPDETLGKVYFGRLFPMGVEALMEAADLVVNGARRASCRTRLARATKGGAGNRKRASTGTPMWIKPIT